MLKHGWEVVRKWYTEVVGPAEIMLNKCSENADNNAQTENSKIIREERAVWQAEWLQALPEVDAHNFAAIASKTLCGKPCERALVAGLHLVQICSPPAGVTTLVCKYAPSPADFLVRLVLVQMCSKYAPRGCCSVPLWCRK